MAGERADVPDAEFAVLTNLWERGPSTVRDLTAAIYPGGTEAHYATVQKLLTRLEAKKMVRRNRGSWAHVYNAAISRDQWISRRLEAVAQRLCGGSLTPLLTSLVRTRRLSAKERQELRDLIEELDVEPPHKRRAKPPDSP
jgi:predicted transcriptional regulator